MRVRWEGETEREGMNLESREIQSHQAPASDISKHKPRSFVVNRVIGLYTSSNSKGLKSFTF